ncbi:MAG: ABC transporter ATP-binding protein/permease [Alicyclobacillus sp.]|nr:ABC transporter ATP-binding protein/permease [Alicyclobacillus sp.]
MAQAMVQEPQAMETQIKVARTLRAFANMWRLLWQGAPAYALLSFLVLVGASVLPVSQTYITSALINGLMAIHQGKQTIPYLLLILGLQTTVSLSAAGLRMVGRLTDVRLQSRIIQRVNDDVIRRTSQLPLVSYDHPDFYNTLHRATAGQASRVSSLLSTSGQVFQSILTVLLYVVALGTISPVLPGLSLIVVIPVIMIQMWIGKRRYLLNWVQTPSSRMLDYVFRLHLSREAAKELRVFGFTAYLHDKWLAIFNRNTEEKIVLERRASWAGLATDALGTLTTSGIVAVLLWPGAGGHISIGQVVGAMQAVTGIYASRQSVAQTVGRLNESALSVSNLFDFLTLHRSSESRSDNIGNVFPSPLSTGIEVTNLTFRYPLSSHTVLDHVSFKVEPGQRVAIIGANGSGKSTLVKCLLGLYEPLAGSVMYDGIDVRSIDQADLRRHVTAIFQDFMRYEFSVRENVAIGNLSRKEDDSWLRDVLTQVGVEEVAADLDAPLGQTFGGGRDLSGGQWQKIAISCPTGKYIRIFKKCK